jgi:hypothetical protein
VKRIRACLPTHAEVVCEERWAPFEETAVHADCAIAVIEWLDRAAGTHDLASFKARFPFQPVVLLTSRDADNARGIADLHVDEVVWLNEVERALAPAIERARTRGFLWCLGGELALSTALSPLLRQALKQACRSRRPPLSVTDLAEIVHHDRRTLWRHWHAMATADRTMRLEDFLGWIMLLQATTWREAGHSWREVAAQLGVHEHTIARTARRLTGWTLRSLAAAGPLEAQDRFRKAVARLLPAADRTH